MPVVTVLGLQVALLLSGAVLTETTFNWPGIGFELVRYLNNRDYIAVQGIITFFALIVIFDQPADRLRQRLDRPEGAVLMAVAARLPDAARAAARPVREARGVPRWIAAARGSCITLLFVVMALTRAADRALRLRPVQGRLRTALRQAAGAILGTHPFGTNVQSTDVMSRVICGARTELKVVLLAVVVVAARRPAAGAVSGYFGGPVDRVLVLIMDALFAFPYLLLAIVIAFLLSDKFGSGVATAAFAISAVYIPQYFRVVRNHVVSLREESYVEAARALGARPRTVIGRYVFQNVVQSVPVIATLNAADAILTLAALGFLGYGIQPTDAAEWGYDSSRALSDAGAGIWWTGLFPGMAIVLLVTGLTLLGEGLNDVLNPVLRRRKMEPVTLPPRVPREDEA